MAASPCRAGDSTRRVTCASARAAASQRPGICVPTAGWRTGAGGRPSSKRRNTAASRWPRPGSRRSPLRRVAGTTEFVASFFERLRQAARSRRSLLCVNLDPDPERIAGGAGAALRHCVAVIERTAEHACCYKPNAAFWEQYGPDGWKALVELRAAIPADVPVLLDAKRADIGSTMTAYGRAVFEAVGADAVTAWPYVGSDALAELTRYTDRAVYLVCRTSNPGAADLQHLESGGRPLYLHVAALAERLNGAGNVGLVVGATAPSELAEVRSATSLPFLVPASAPRAATWSVRCGRPGT